MTLVINIGIDPVLVRLGPLAIHWYGLMYVIGIWAGLRAALPYAVRHGINTDTAYRLFWPVVVASLLGGRLYYVVQSNLGSYLSNPLRILATWEGGMAFYGAVLLGFPALYLGCRGNHVSFPVALDAAALFIPLAQTFGRVGNLVNGDIIGYPSSLPWATRYTNPHNTFVPNHTQAFDPAALYELLFSLALFGLLFVLSRRRHLPGSLFATWLTLYAVGQFLLFFLRDNPVVWLGLKQAQLTSIAALIIAIPFWLYLRQRRSTVAGPSPV